MALFIIAKIEELFCLLVDKKIFFRYKKNIHIVVKQKNS